ncbi:MAG: D-alanine--poly(phosphoribitol) ligase subunit DltA [Eggerthellaceae bacterium]|nr:D-alanine--poly(phosphoribitol) ligase subunit DltA [Eggerthellaceae bacterium]
MARTYLELVDAQATARPDCVAFVNTRGERITYAQLKAQSDALARWIAANPAIPQGVPLIVYGHKSPLMLVCFLACAKSGHAYAPVDIVYPAARVESIISQLGDTALFDTRGTLRDLLGGDVACPLFGVDAISEAISAQPSPQAPEPRAVEDRDPHYVIFTSGSTGTPKGVVVTADCLTNFTNWFCASEFAAPGPRIWFDRAPFSFDLSVTDLAGALAAGDTMFALEEEAEASLALTFEEMGKSGMTDWVSTPSFLDQCLADPSFGPDLLPNLRRMIFVGETLRPETVRRAYERFDDLRIFNGYGPTESTDMVTLCEITGEMLEADKPLPVGYARPGTRLAVLDPDTLVEVPRGTAGELFIVGDTVAAGYWGRDDLTQAGFASCPESIARGERSYRTGDEAMLDEEGMLHFHGRLDLQIKLHGFRIELGDIESVIGALPQVQSVCVLPVNRDGVISHLVACVVPAADVQERGFKLSKQLKSLARESLPSYMIPTNFKYLEELPLNANGKVDRRALAAIIEG